MNRLVRGGLRAAVVLLTAGLCSAAPLTALAASPTPEIHRSPDIHPTPSPSHSASPSASPTPSPSPRTSPTPTPTPRPTTDEVVGLKASVLAAIDRRLGSVRALKATVVGSKVLTDGDRAALAAQLDSSAAGLTALAARVSAETEIAAVRRDALAVVADFRVDDLLAPKVHLVIAADYVIKSATSEDALAARLGPAIAREKAAGRDTRSTEALIADILGQTTAARSAASPVPAAVLALSAAGFPGNEPALKAARAAIESAGADLHRAADDAHRAVDALKLLTQADLKASGHAMIQDRLKTLTGLGAEVHASKSISDGDRSALLTLLSTDQSGLAALDRRIQGDTDPKSLEADIKSVYTDYRIYALVEPKVELVLAADSMSGAEAKLRTAGDRIATLIAEARAKGRDTSAAEAALADLVAHDTAAGAKLTGVSADLLGLTTEGYPANQTQLATDRRSIEDAHAELVAAGRDARRALLALK